jgi:hypothetical protein
MSLLHALHNTPLYCTSSRDSCLGPRLGVERHFTTLRCQVDEVARVSLALGLASTPAVPSKMVKQRTRGRGSHVRYQIQPAAAPMSSAPPPTPTTAITGTPPLLLLPALPAERQQEKPSGKGQCTNECRRQRGRWRDRKERVTQHTCITGLGVADLRHSSSAIAASMSGSWV